MSHLIAGEANVVPLIASLEAVEVPARTVLIGEGDAAQHLYFITKGAIRVWLNNEGKDVTLQFFFEGDGATSLESFLYNEPSPFSIETIEHTTLSVLPRATFDEWMAADAAFKDWFYGTAVHKQLQHTKRLLSLITRTPAQRYEDVLTLNPELLQRIPQQYIASYLGITAESLSRIRGRLRRATS